MKKVWLAAVLILLALLLTGTALANTGEALDVIMILDCSGSMRDNDVNQLMLKAAMNFIDMCDVNGSRVAIVPFNNESLLVAPQWEACGRFRALDNVAERELLRHDLLTRFSYNNDTDAGPAFELAWQLYNQHREERNAGENIIVVFFSDGKIEIRNNKKVDTGRTGRSMETAERYITEMAAAHIPVYCIGLKGASGDFDKVWLDSIAQRTGTGAARVVVDGNSAVLHETFSEIFAAYLGTEPLELDSRDIVVEDGMAVIAIDIPNNSILEANIRLSLQNPGRNSRFGDVGTLLMPNGQEVVPITSGTPGPGDVIVGNSGAYYNVKLIRPVQGQWKLMINVNEAELVNAEMISNYDIAIRFREIDTASLAKGDSVTLEAEFYSTQTGEVYSDEYLCQLGLITESIATYNGEPIADFYQVDETTRRFVGTIDRLDDGEYKFQVIVNGDGIHTQTDLLTLSLDNHPPVRIGEDPSALTLSVDSLLWRQATDTYEINLREYFRDQDGDVLHFTRSGVDSEMMQTRITEAGVLQITCLTPGEGTLTIKCDDGIAEANRTLPIAFTITSCKSQAIRELIFGILALLILSIVVGAILYKNRGRFVSTAAFEASYAGLTINPLPHSMIYLSRYNDKKVSLCRVLDDAGTNMDTCKQLTTTETTFLSGIILDPKRKGVVKVLNQSTGHMRISISGAPLERRQSCLLNNGSNIEIMFMEDGRSISLRYHY